MGQKLAQHFTLKSLISSVWSYGLGFLFPQRGRLSHSSRGLFASRFVFLQSCFLYSVCSKLPFFLVDERAEVADSAAIERDVTGKWIDLKNKEAGIKQDKSDIKTHAGEFGICTRE